MKIHHLNCGCMCPLGGALFDGYSRGLFAHLVCHCWLIETDRDGLVLVDTGFGSAEVANPERLSRFFRYFNNLQLKPELTALAQIRLLGFAPADVRHIVLTHLDFDHAGGLDDFPDATVHVMQAEYRTAKTSQGWLSTRRYCAAQWGKTRYWRFYAADGESWNGFARARPVLGDAVEGLVLVPLPGHTYGHAGVAVNDTQGWRLHAGDAYFNHDEVHGKQRHCPPGMRFYQRMMDADHSQRVLTQNRLRALVLTADDELIVNCSHDANELRRLSATSSAGLPTYQEDA